MNTLWHILKRYMTWLQIEKMFNRSFRFCFSKRKWIMVFPFLSFCGLLCAICRTLFFGAGDWVQMTLTFLPIFLCAGFLLAIGIVLIRVYHHEIKGLPIHYLKMINDSRPLFLKIPYLAIPVIFLYLISWMILGVFFLFRSIPKAGEFVGAFLSFGPFLLVLGSLVLSVICLLTLFFLTPKIALKSDFNAQMMNQTISEIKTNPFLTFILPLLGLLPLLIFVGILSLAATLTHIFYMGPVSSIANAMKWFFISVPFSALLTPAIIFFFNFAAESLAVFRKGNSPSSLLNEMKEMSSSTRQ